MPAQRLLDEQFGLGVEPLPVFGREPTVSLLQGADVKATCLVSESGTWPWPQDVSTVISAEPGSLFPSAAFLTRSSSLLSAKEDQAYGSLQGVQHCS